MAYYYKIGDGETVAGPPLERIKVFNGNSADCSSPCIKYDFSKHVLIELLDNVTPEAKLWTELGLANSKSITHKRMIIDPHRVNCRRAIVVCSSSDEAKELALKLSQAKIMKRCICAVVIQELLSDICLFEKQIIQYGDKRSQHQLVYVTELTKRREPSGLAQYLREKFSPFGTILSILVSEEKDGHAYPEGVIKFAHLSEAFAAELAYDQCAVALERLSVTTHHNILLSQCDLRARLREAYTKQSNEFSFNVDSPESQIENKPSKSTDLDHNKNLPSNNAKGFIKESKDIDLVLNESGSTVDGNNGFSIDSTEISDVLKKPCESNLINCLQSIAACSESSDSRQASVSSLAETELGSIGQSTLPLSINDTSTLPFNKTWSSRILGWITDLSNGDLSSQVDVTINNDAVDENGAFPESIDLIDKHKNLGDNQQPKPSSPLGIVSSASSFVTCTNNDLNSSFNSVLTSFGEVNDSNNVITVEDKVLPHGSKYNPDKISEKETPIANGSSIWKSTPIKSNNSPVLPSKRRNTSMMTQKLSLKSKRMNTSQSSTVSEVLGNNTTVALPSDSKTKSCSVVLNSFPELDEFAKNLSIAKSTTVLLERLSVSPPIDSNMNVDQANILDSVEKEANIKKHSKKEMKEDPSSIESYSKKKFGSSSSGKSQTIRRSSRLTPRGSDKRSNNFNRRYSKNGTKSSVSADRLKREKKILDETV